MMNFSPRTISFSRLAGISIACWVLTSFGIAPAAEPNAVHSTQALPLNQDGQLMIGGVAQFPLAVFINIEPRWTSTDPARVDALLKELSNSPFKVLINSSGTIGTLDEISTYHRELAKHGLCEIVGIQDYYSSDTITNRVPDPDALAAGEPDEQAVRAVIRELGKYPTVAGWYIFDTVPENPPLIAEHYAWVKQEDPGRPVFLQCYFAWYQQDRFLPACDVLLNEIFPFDKLLAQAAQFEIASPAKYNKSSKPVWAVIQGHSWFRYSIYGEVQRLINPDAAPAIETERTRVPTKGELVNLALHAWTQGHSGAAFSYPHSILTPDESDRRWPVIRQAAEELKKFSSILASPLIEDGVSSDTSTVRCKLVQSEGARYLIVVNASQSPQTTSLHLSQPAATLEIIAGDGQATVSGQQVPVTLDVWQTLVAKLE